MPSTRGTCAVALVVKKRSAQTIERADVFIELLLGRWRTLQQGPCQRSYAGLHAGSEGRIPESRRARRETETIGRLAQAAPPKEHASLVSAGQLKVNVDESFAL